MNIALNALAMRSINHGVGNYISNLLIELVRNHPDDKLKIFISAGNKDLPRLLKGKNVTFEIVALPRPLRLIWEQVILPFKARQFDVLHCPVHIIPFIKTTKYVVTELDLTFFIEPDRHNFGKRIYFQTFIPFSCRIADRIISISHSTENDLVRILGISKEKIEVIPLAASNIKRVEAQELLRKTVSKYNLPEKFILFLGVLEPRKNVAGLIEAFAKVKGGIDSDLVIAGSDGYGWDKNEVFDKVKELDLSKRVHFIGRVDEKDKASLYSLAEMFIYPSFYEGFGIPVLEAMACGVPVITSNLSSLPEIAGDAAVLIDPHNTSALADKINKLSKDFTLRQKMIANGIIRAKSFSWSRTAEETYATYKNI